jgi:hypothetical protein
MAENKSTKKPATPSSADHAPSRRKRRLTVLAVAIVLLVAFGIYANRQMRNPDPATPDGAFWYDIRERIVSVRIRIRDALGANRHDPWENKAPNPLPPKTPDKK